MSDLASALAAPEPGNLQPYRGRPVVRVEAKVTNVGDGLSESLGVGAHELEQGQEVDLLVRCVVGPHQIRVLRGYDDEETDAPLRLVMTLIGKTVTIVDGDFADERIRMQKLRNQRAADDAKGNQRLPGSDGWDDEDAKVDQGDEATNVHELPVAPEPDGPVDEEGWPADTQAQTADTEAEGEGPVPPDLDGAVTDLKDKAATRKPRRRSS